MKKILTFVIIFNALLLAANNEDNNSERKSRIEKQIKKEMEREKKFAKEQTFYQAKEYDLKGAEVDKESLLTLPEQEVDDLDMDDVYD